MDLHQLPADAALHPDQAHGPDLPASWLRLSRLPSTVEQVLQRARLAMLEEDRLEQIERDPVRFLGSPRRRSLLGRLLGR
jgi:hypothetical protein